MLPFFFFFFCVGSEAGCFYPPDNNCPVGKRLNFPRDASAEKVYRYTLSFRQKRDHVKEICHLWIVVFVKKTAVGSLLRLQIMIFK